MPFDPLSLTRLKGNDAKLTHLVCKDTQLNDEDIEQLCVVLKNNITLEELNLSANKIGNEGARLLAECLKTNNTLQTLILNNNQIGNTGAEAFVRCLEVNKYLRILDLKENSIWLGRSITSETLHSIYTLLRGRPNPNLQFLVHPLTIGAGATSLITRYTADTFSAYVDGGTMGYDFHSKLEWIEGHRVKLKLWHIRGAVSSETMALAIARHTIAYICCIEPESIMSENFFTNSPLNTDLESIKRRIGNYALCSDGDIFFVITRYDQIAAAQKDQFEKNIARLRDEFPHFPVFITSAKNNYNIQSTFKEITKIIWERLSNNNTPKSKSTAVVILPADSKGKLAVASKPEPQIVTVPSTQSDSKIDNAFLTDLVFNQYPTLANALPPSSLTLLKNIKEQGGNLDHVLFALTQLQKNHENIAQRLENIEVQAGLDANTQAEILYINNNESLNRYYQALKMLLGQTFLAAKVISSGDVSTSQGKTAAIVNGICTAAGALSSCCTIFKFCFSGSGGS